MCYQFTTLRTADLLDCIVAAVDYARGSTAPAPWQRAIDAGYDYLLQVDEIVYDEMAGAIRVESATEPGRFYESNGACQCASFTKGTGVCWHRAAARLVKRALELRDLAAELLAEADDVGADWYGPAEAQMGARWRMGELLAAAADWDQMAQANQEAALGQRIALARAALAAAA